MRVAVGGLCRQLLAQFGIEIGSYVTSIGSITIEIGRARQDSWLFSVRDQGRGIAETDLENIFEPFWQAEDSARTSAFGVGLGLSIVQQFVELMNGKIEVTSELGQGSVFTVTLPLLLPAVASAGGAAGSQD